MPKIVRILNRFNIGGPSYNAALLTKYLAPEFETRMVGGMWEKDEENSLFLFRDLGIEPQLVTSMKRKINPVNDWDAYRQIKKILKEFKPDIVHTHSAKAGTLGRMAAMHCHIPHIVHTFHGHVFHSYFGTFKTGLYKKTERFFAKKSGAIITLSEKQKKEICLEHKIVPIEKTFVIPLGFDLRKFIEEQEKKRIEFRKQFKVAEDEICIVIIGRLVPVKNHSLFIRAMAFLKANSKRKIRAFIIGDGNQRTDLMNTAKELGIESVYWPEEQKPGFLTFTSWIRDVSYPLAGSDIVTLTSHNEGTPVSLIEAQVAKKPIVTTCVGGIEDSVNPKGAFLIEPGDEANFNDKLFLLTEDDALRTKMSLESREFVQEKFDYTILVENMRKLYNSLLNI